MEVLLAFGAALLALRLAGLLAGRWRARGGAHLAIWSSSLAAYAGASGALAWGAAAGWDGRSFRVYYLFGGLLTAPLLGLGSLALVRWRPAASLAWAYAGLAAGIAIAVPLEGHIAGAGIPEAQSQLTFFPARALAVLGNSLGTLAVVAVGLATIRRRPAGNALILLGVGLAALGSALAGLGVAGTAGLVAAAAVLLYLGIVR